jgi:hypothetical protein
MLEEPLTYQVLDVAAAQHGVIPAFELERLTRLGTDEPGTKAQKKRKWRE